MFLREESVGVGSYDPSMSWFESKVDDLMNMSSEQILEEVLDEGDPAFDTKQWLSYNTILKTAIESTENPTSIPTRANNLVDLSQNLPSTDKYTMPSQQTVYTLVSEVQYTLFSFFGDEQRRRNMKIDD